MRQPLGKSVKQSIQGNGRQWLLLCSGLIVELTLGLLKGRGAPSGEEPLHQANVLFCNYVIKHNLYWGLGFDGPPESRVTPAQEREPLLM